VRYFAPETEAALPPLESTPVPVVPTDRPTGTKAIALFAGASILLFLAPLLAAGALVWETAWYLRRAQERQRLFQAARQRADALGRRLVVVGSPDGGVTSSPCGDITVDIAPSAACPNSLQADISKPLPFGDDSVVVFVSCVLEYVEDYPGAVSELLRISGGELFVCRVEPWTLTAYFYPGARRCVPSTVGCQTA